jgi:redox-sensitive bicupin YhaK (pirin superfamily)
MVKNRPIKKVYSSKPRLEGAGVHLKRAFGFNEVPEFDPFLLLYGFLI